MNAVHFRMVLRLLVLMLAMALPVFGAVSWSTNGPSYKSIRAIAVSPQDTNVVYAGAFGWGVFKSTDGGASWISVKAGLTNAYVRSIVAVSNATAFCGTNDGVFKTTDGGTTWTLSVATPFSVRGLAYHAPTNHLFAGTYGSGLYKSTNQGASWVPVTVHDPVSNETLSHQWSVVLFGSDSLYVGGSILDIGTGGALFKSLDGGATWVQVQRGIGIRSSVRSIAVSPANPDLSLIIGTAAKGVYKSTNAGVNWTEVNAGTTPNPLPDLQINAVGFSSQYRYAGDDSLGGFYRRALGDTSFGWQAGTGLPGPQALVSSIAINRLQQNSILLGTEGGGVYRSTNAGLAWTARNSGMLGTAPRVIRRNGNGQIFAGMEFGDGLWISSDQGLSWSATAIGTANAITSIGITNTPAVVYAGAYGSGVFKSTDAGVTWTITDSTVLNHFVRTLSVNPSNAALAYAGTGNGVYVTTNGGANWVAKNTGIPAGTSVRSMALDPVNTNLLFAGSDSAYLYRSTDGGANWTNVTAANGFLPQDIFIRSITIDNANHTTLYVGADSGRIYKSTNSGSSWTLHAQLPIGHSVRSVLIHPNDHKVFFCATFGDGVFTSADSGAHWAPMNAGLADLEFFTLESDQANPLTLYAGSGMHGVYRTAYTFVDHPPVLASIGNKNVLAGGSLNFGVTASDSEGTFPLITASGLPAGASFVDSANGHGRFTWTPTVGQIGSHIVTFAASDGALADSEQITISVLDPGSSTIVPMSADAGWNLLSVPVIASDFRKSVLFSTATSSAFAYAGGYAVRETLSNGNGYWLKYASAQNFTLGGGPLSQETVAVRAGWNIVGSLSNSVSASSVTPVSPVVITSSIFGFNVIAGYASADSIRPGQGYWLKASQAGSVIIGPGPVAEGVAGLRSDAILAVSDERLRDFITFIDRYGRSRGLSVVAGVSAHSGSAHIELPPVPPSGVFDVRYGGVGASEVEFPEGDRGASDPVEISGSGGSVTVAWDIRSSGRSYELSLGGRAILMEGRGSMAVRTPQDYLRGELAVRRSVGGPAAAPAGIVLEQNYPNPFNPSTLLRFELPSGGFVSLKVFDLLGREVAILVNGELPAGSYARVWDAAEFGSGIYYCRLDVTASGSAGGPAHQVKKMFLVK